MTETAWMEKHRMRRGCDASGSHILYCRACKGVGASLTKHCVGRMLTDSEEAEIAAGRLGFVSGEWIRALPRISPD